MDIEKVISFSVQFFSDYWWGFTETLRNPTSRFSTFSLIVIDTPKEILLSHPQENKHLRLNPKLLGFIAISIFIGSTINELIPGRTPPDLGFTTIFIVIAAVWFFYGFVLHVLCKLFKGKGSYEDTLRVSLQLFSVIYVVSSFIAFLGGILLTAFNNPLIPVHSVLAFGQSLNQVEFKSIYLFFYAEFILLVIYLPIAVKHLHHFGWARVLSISVVSAVIFVLFSFISFSQARNMPVFSFSPPLPSRFYSTETIPFPFNAFIENDRRLIGGALLGSLTGIVFIVWLFMALLKNIVGEPMDHLPSKRKILPYWLALFVSVVLSCVLEKLIIDLFLSQHDVFNQGVLLTDIPAPTKALAVIILFFPLIVAVIISVIYLIRPIIWQVLDKHE